MLFSSLFRVGSGASVSNQLPFATSDRNNSHAALADVTLSDWVMSPHDGILTNSSFPEVISTDRSGSVSAAPSERLKLIKLSRVRVLATPDPMQLQHQL